MLLVYTEKKNNNKKNPLNIVKAIEPNMVGGQFSLFVCCLTLALDCRRLTRAALSQVDSVLC